MKMDMSFVGQPGTVLNGARVLTSSFTRGAHWVIEGQTQQGLMRGLCELPDGACTRPEAVFFNGRELTQVMSLSALSPGEFYLDYAADELYLAEDPAGSRVEATFVPAAFRGSGGNVKLQGMTLARFNNPAGVGAIHLYGSNNQIVDNEIRQNGGIGVCTGGIGTRVVNNYIHHNGQMGMCGNGDNMLIAGNEIAFNNTQGHRYG